MPSPRFPAAATLLEARQCPLEKFDALFAKITRERRIADGYFLREHPDGARLLFVVNGSPFGAGRVVGQACVFQEIHEFFAAYAAHPASPLSFFVANKRLLLGMMVLFRHQPSLSFKTDVVEMSEILDTLAERNLDQILGLRFEGEWAIALCAKGRPSVTFFPPDVADSLKDALPADQLLAYARSRQGGVAVDVYEETRVVPAGDATLVTPETRDTLTEVFLKVAARVHEEEEIEALPVIEVASETAPAIEMIAPESVPEQEKPELAPEMEMPEVVLDLDEPLSVSEQPVQASPAQTPPEAAPPPSAPAPKLAGAPPEILLFLGDKQLGAFLLEGGELTIGRIPGNSIVIDNAGVSRRHAAIHVKGDKVFLQDLGSANGTIVRGQKVDSHELQDGDEITIVKHRLVYRTPKEAEAPSRPDAMVDGGQSTMYIDPTTIAQALGPGHLRRSDSGAGPMLRPRLILPDLKKFALEEEEVTLGSGAAAQIQLSGMFIGRMHAKIVRTKDGQFKLHHLSGLAGTRVNGEKISEHLLKHGDEIEIGKQKLLFRLER
jgi:pSer/pThr/pTyr-binding forkhead associated (FHA) protein